MLKTKCHVLKFDCFRDTLKFKVNLRELIGDEDEACVSQLYNKLTETHYRLQHSDDVTRRSTC